MPDTPPISPDELATLNARFENAHPVELIQWAGSRFGNAATSNLRQGLVMTSSFGADSMCTIHLAAQVIPDIPIIVINTGYLFPETLEFMKQMRVRFKLNIREYHTQNDPVVWLSVNGEPDPRYRQNVDACCAANKNSVMDHAMRDLAPTAWIRGVRADQTAQRATMLPIEWSGRHHVYAISPILRWTSRDVYQYMKQHDLPHHPLYEQGYVSIGCNPLTCTRPITADDDQRSGRWSGTGKQECGINLDEGANI